MAWVYLLVAGVLEVVWATAMKMSDGYSRLWPTAIMLVTMLLSFLLLSLAMRSLPLGTSYAIWTGIGAVGAFIVGILWLGDPLTPMRLAAAALIVAGIVMMKLATPA